MVLTIDILKFRNAEYIQFGRDFLAILALNNQTALKVVPQYIAFDKVIGEIEALFKTDQGSNLTPLIDAMDERRDMAVTGIFKYIEAFTNHFDADKKQAGDLLMNQLKVYGTISSVITSSLSAETAIVNSLVADFTTKAQFKGAMELLALGDWLTELQTANELLSNKYIERTVELGGANPSNIKDKRNEANLLYYALRNMLVAQATVALNAPPYPKTINELNALIEQNNVTLAGRANTKNDDDPSDDGKSNDDIPEA